MELDNISPNQFLYVLALAVVAWVIVYLISHSSIPEPIRTIIYIFLALVVLFWIF